MLKKIAFKPPVNAKLTKSKKKKETRNYVVTCSANCVIYPNLLYNYSYTIYTYTNMIFINVNEILA